MGVSEFLRAGFFCETPGGCFSIISISNVVFFEFRYFAFHYLTFDIDIIYFFII